MLKAHDAMDVMTVTALHLVTHILHSSIILGQHAIHRNVFTTDLNSSAAPADTETCKVF